MISKRLNTHAVLATRRLVDMPLQKLATALALIGMLMALAQPAGAGSPSANRPQTAREPSARGAAWQGPPAPVEPGVLDQIAEGGQATFWILLAEGADLTSAPEVQAWDRRGLYVYEQLQSTARASQAGLVDLLQARGASYQPFWIVNAIRVSGGLALVNELAARPEVAQILAERAYEIPEPHPAEAIAGGEAIEWNISRIRAPEVWSTFGIRGEGIVVANIDSGVQYDHPALVRQYRGYLGGGAFDHNYNWFDPAIVCETPSKTPCDNNGHGTHTMGTMVGDDGDPGPNQIGVAPGARWIAAKGCESSWCSDFALLASGQWVLAPTDLNGQNPRPDLRPHVVNNSWGGLPGDIFYRGIVNAWVAAGIFPVFANGNSGPGCFSSGSPGDYPGAYSVGAFDSQDAIADFSSRGPSAFSGVTKPDIAAPGVAVRSSWPTNGYDALDGTSMAAPHAAGTVALMWSAAPSLAGDIPATRALLDQTAIDTEDLNCGGTPGDNNVWGEGRLDAFTAVERSPRGPTGTLQGTVTDNSTGQPLGGVSIRAAGPVERTTTSGAAGQYSMLLQTGAYTVTASLFGFYPGDATGVQVISGTLTLLDFSLDPAPAYPVSGRVIDANTGWPLYARIHIQGAPGGALWTDPVTGRYTATLAAGIEYNFQVSAWMDGYQADARAVGPLAGPEVQDFSLEVDPVACTAPGYVPVYTFLEDFESGLDGWALTGLWNPEGESDACGSLIAPFPNGSQAVYYGSDEACNYNTGGANQGTLTLNTPVTLPAAGPVGLSVWSYELTECSGDCDWDNRTVEISTDGGGSWEPLGELGAEGAWYQARFDLGPYLGGDIQVRLGFDTVDEIGNDHLGWMVDDVGIVTGCVPSPGGLVVGNVHDQNTGEGLVDALVTHEAGASVLTRATPDDPHVPDGFYALFSPAGTQVITATLRGGYAPDVQTPGVAPNDTVRQDFHLPAGWLSSTPQLLQATLQIGESTITSLSIDNAGDVEAAFTLQERETGFFPVNLGAGSERKSGRGEWLYRADGSLPPGNVGLHGRLPAGAGAHPSAYRWQPEQPAGALRVLLYAHDFAHPAPFTFPDQALQYLGLPYTAHYYADFEGFESALVDSAWDLVIVAHEHWIPSDSLWSALNEYVVDGGRLILHSWAVNFVPEHPLWATLGIESSRDDLNPPGPVYWWDPPHRVFKSPHLVPEFTQLNEYVLEVNGQHVTVLPDFEALAGFTTPGPDPGEAALILGNFGSTVFRGFMDGHNDADLDADGILDGVELWINLIDGIQARFSTDIPWLVTDIVSGTVPSQGSQMIQVTFDAGVPEVVQPGDYHGEVRVVNDTPYGSFTIPVSLTVSPPPTWGKLVGTVSGLARCDAPGAPLANASVVIGDADPLTTGPDGAYHWWLEQGTYTVTVSAGGFLPQTGSVNITAGGTATADFTLRPLAACGTASPPALDITARTGEVLTRTLMLGNSGAGDLGYALLETLFTQPAAALPERGSGDRPPDPGTPLPVGPLASRNLAGWAGPGSQAPQAVASNWFAALDVPRGVASYAHAQCAEQPGSFYVISGLDFDLQITMRVRRYDVSTNTWAELAPIPAGSDGPRAVCHQGKIYVAGGVEPNLSVRDSFLIYDIASDTWSEGPDLPRPVWGAALGAWGGSVYVIGGDDDTAPGNGVSDRVEVYDIAAGAWIGAGAPLPVAAVSPGYVQAGPHVYVVGGFGDGAPDFNVSATQRYDMTRDVWETGPAFTSARADFALAATGEALYAIGGDADGEWFFDATDLVERLDLSAWPDGAWEALDDPLPGKRIANNAGFCTPGPSGSQVWSVGGADVFWFAPLVTGDNRFLVRAGEGCFALYTDVPWLAADPVSGTVPGDSANTVTVSIDTAGLAPGSYAADLVATTDDPGATQIRIPVRLTLVDAGPALFKVYLPLFPR